MDCIKRQNELRVEIQSVCLYKGKWVVRLRLNIYTENIKSGHGVSGSSTTGTTE